MKTTTLSFVLISLIFLISCKKKVSCDAILCVKNTGQETIHYSWGSSAYTDSIMPGESACKSAGHIEIESGSSSTSVEYFNSDHGHYAIEVDECQENHEIE